MSAISSVISDVFLFGNFIRWLPEAAGWLPAPAVYMFLFVYGLFYVGSFSHIALSNFSVLGLKTAGSILWYRSFWSFLMVFMHFSVIGYWIWRGSLMRSETNRRKAEEECMMKQLEERIEMGREIRTGRQ